MNYFQVCSSAVLVAIFMTGCSAPTPLAPSPPPSPYTSVPDLAPYMRFELYAQKAGPSEKPLAGNLKFRPEGARLDFFKTDGTEIGRLHIQPDTCRDDPSPACERRFLVNGRIQALDANMSCAVPVRNDMNAGYRAQTLSGLCQSQFGRAYTLQLFPQ